MTARDTTALALQVEALAAQVDRLAGLVEALQPGALAITAIYQAGQASTHRGAAPGPRGRGHRGGLSVVRPDGTPGGAA